MWEERQVRTEKEHEVGSAYTSSVKDSWGKGGRVVCSGGQWREKEEDTKADKR